MSAGPCTAITKAGRSCGKTTGTQPSPDGTGVRCYSHMLPFLAKKDPSARCPVQKPRSAADVRRIVDWALVRAAEGKLSAPAANSVSSMAKTWLRVNADHSEETSNVLLDVLGAMTEQLTAMDGIKDRGAYDRAGARVQAGWDRLHELHPMKETDKDAAAREDRRTIERGPDGLPLDDLDA